MVSRTPACRNRRCRHTLERNSPADRMPRPRRLAFALLAGLLCVASRTGAQARDLTVALLAPPAPAARPGG